MKQLHKCQWEYDVFLAGPWEQYAKEPYKERLKQNFPQLRYYDPETDSRQKEGLWFQDNYYAMKNSNVLVSHECSFPGAGSTRETGIFYGIHGDGVLPLDRLVTIFFEDLQPRWGVLVAEKMGVVVYNVQQAEEYLKKYFKLK
jgi:hypothetical protein